ncbi:unnamed protein product, partial [Didymodactylos carnosus]
MSNSPSSSTTRACSNSKDNTNDVADKYSTTSNFVRHMKRKHEFLYKEWSAKKNVNNDNKQRNIDDMIKQKTSKYSSIDPRQIKLTESIIKDLIIDVGVSLSLVEQNGFKNFMHVVDPMYSLLSRRQ